MPAAACAAQEPGPPTAAAPGAEEEEKPLPGDWAVELLDAVGHSSNTEAGDALYRAVVATGPAIIPQLQEALKDDRTAEFAAQALAFIGGQKAVQILWSLQTDKRDLNLRRFYYGALAEFDAPEATQTLLGVINRADQEPDRTVTEAAILALTVRSDPKLLVPLREALARTKDVVIQLDLENALAVIESRAKLLAAPGVKPADGSVKEAVRAYFAPALVSPDSAVDSPTTVPKPAGARATTSGTAPQLPPARGSATKPSARGATGKPAGQAAPVKPAVDLRIQNLTLTPDKTRALARVSFEDPTAVASYDIVLQKRYGEWSVASVWLGTEAEKAPTKPEPPEPEPE